MVLLSCYVSSTTSMSISTTISVYDYDKGYIIARDNNRGLRKIANNRYLFLASRKTPTVITLLKCLPGSRWITRARFCSTTSQRSPWNNEEIRRRRRRDSRNSDQITMVVNFVIAAKPINDVSRKLITYLWNHYKPEKSKWRKSDVSTRSLRERFSVWI